MRRGWLESTADRNAAGDRLTHFARQSLAAITSIQSRQPIVLFVDSCINSTTPRVVDGPDDRRSKHVMDDRLPRFESCSTGAGRWSLNRIPVPKMLRILLLATFAICRIAWADTIAISPGSPTANDTITFTVEGVSPASPSFVIFSHVIVQDATIRLEACINYAGFATPSNYEATFVVNNLLPRTYQVEYYRARCAQTGEVIVPYELRVTQSVLVANGVGSFAIPTLHWAIVALLMLLIASIGIAHVRSRT